MKDGKRQWGFAKGMIAKELPQTVLLNKKEKFLRKLMFK